MPLNIPDEELNLVAEIENSIRDRLTQLTEIGAKVVVEPSTLTDVGKTQTAGRLTIACIDSQFSRPPSGLLTGGQQIEEMHFQLDWRLRDLRTHQEAWRVIRAILYLLHGWHPHHCNDAGLFCLGIELQEQNAEGYWVIYMMFGLRFRRQL